MAALVRLIGRGSIEAVGQVWEPAADRRSALLYYVAFARGWVSREDLLVLFWPDSDERRARANLRQLLVAVRALPFATELEVEPTRVRWPVATDLQTFDEAFERGELEALGDAWARPLLDGFRLATAPEFESWLELERIDRVERTRAGVCEVARRSLSEGRASAAATLLDRWLLSDPMHEEAFRLWAEASASTGMRTSVLARYESFAARLAGAFGVEPEPATTALVERVRLTSDAGNVGVLVAFGSGSRHVRPRATRLGGFVGREPELARLTEVLVPGAVVAVVGAGGMGKTRLALEAANRMVAHFADGVVCAELNEVRDADQVGSVLARALGLDFPPRASPLEAVAEVLAHRQTLVVLDNVEQIDDFEQVLARWCRSAPSAAWLVTSRRSLEMRDVSVLDLDGLAYPPDPDGEPAGAAFPAVELLMQRARQVGVALDLERDRTHVARVARFTAGMPLALELAAGWLRVIPIEVVADELAAGIDLLRAADGRTAPRHASVRAVFEASWSVLSHAERAALVALAPFRGGFTEAAARAVADVGRPMLLALRNKSFVSLGARGRFVQHPLLEAYVRERAASDPALVDARARHARWAFDLLEEQERLGQRGAAAKAVAAVVDELANVEAAWTHAVEAGDGSRFHVGGVTMVNAFRQAGRAARYDELVRGARRGAVPGTAAWAWLNLQGWSMGADRFGRDEEAFEEVEVALATLRRVERDPYWLAWALFVFANSAIGVGRRGLARTAIAEAAERFTALEDWDLVGEMRVTEYLLAEAPDERHRLFEVLEALVRRTGNTDLAVRGKRLHARFVATTFGDWGTALRLIEGVIAIERGRSAPPGRLVDPLLGAAGLTAAIGDLEAADAYAAEAQARASEMGPSGRDWLAAAIAERARLAWLRDDVVRAAALLDEVSDAGNGTRVEALRARLAVGSGDAARARVHVERAAAGSPGVLDGRAQAVEDARIGVLRAEVAVAAGDLRTARDALDGAISQALSSKLLPELLGALAGAVPLVPVLLGDELRSWVTVHPAAEYEVRRRVSAPHRAASVGGPGHDWPAAVAMAQRVLTALRVRVDEGTASSVR